MIDVPIPELESRLAGFPAGDVSLTRLDLLNQLAWEIALTDPARSQALRKEALKLSRAVHYRPGIAAALRTMAYSTLIKTRLRRALILAQAARELFSQLEDLYGYGTATDIASNCYQYIGNYERALEYAIEYNAVAREIGYRRGEAWSLYNMGAIYMAINDSDLARERLEAAFEIFNAINHPSGSSRVLFVLGGLVDKLGDPAAALKYLQSSYAISEQLGMVLGKASALMEIGRIYQATGRVTEALDCHNRCLELVRQIQNKNIEAETRLSLGRLAFELKQLTDADRHLREALHVLENTEALPTTWRVHQLLGDVLAAEKQFEEALFHVKEAHRIKEIVYNNESQSRINNLQIRLKLESAEKEAELDRLRYQETAAAEARLSRTLAVLSEDLEMARRVQRSLLPDHHQYADEFEVAVHFEPMIQIGGDIYDIFETGPGRLRLFLADATGHGVQAALNTMLIKNEYERLRESDLPLGELLGELNRTYIRRFASLGAFFSCTIVDLDLANQRLRMASGGHPEQFLYSQGEVRELQARGAVIGAFPEARFSEIQAPLAAGDRLLLFSDGIEEIRAPDDEFYGIGRLRDNIARHGATTASAAEFTSALIADAHNFRAAAPATDDITLMVAIVP